jgi:hypothetical protein
MARAGMFTYFLPWAARPRRRRPGRPPRSRTPGRWLNGCWRRHGHVEGTVADRRRRAGIGLRRLDRAGAPGRQKGPDRAGVHAAGGPAEGTLATSPSSAPTTNATSWGVTDRSASFASSAAVRTTMIRRLLRSSSGVGAGHVRRGHPHCRRRAVAGTGRHAAARRALGVASPLVHARSRDRPGAARRQLGRSGVVSRRHARTAAGSPPAGAFGRRT